MTTDVATGQPTPSLIDGIIPELLAEEATARAARAAGKPQGPITGFHGIDDELNGFLSPGLHVILSAPGTGKTALALQIAAQCGCPALVVTAEMRPVELLRRTAARVTGTYLGRLRGGDLSPEALSHILASTAAGCLQVAVLDATINEAMPEAILHAAEGLRARFEADHVLIALDSLTDWATAFTSGGKVTEYDATEAALNALKVIALRLKVPILTIVHSNRVSQGAGVDRQLHAGKATGRIEYVAQSLWYLERDGSMEPDSHGKTAVKLTLVKNRDGVTGRCLSFKFEGRLQRFTEG